MRKIKLIRVYHNNCYDIELDATLIEGASEWNEVSEEDFQFINNHLHLLPIERKRGYAGKYIIVEEVPFSAPVIIDDIKKVINKQIQERLKQQAEIDRKKREAAEIRAAKKLERNKKALQRLIKDDPSILEGIIVESAENE